MIRKFIKRYQKVLIAVISEKEIYLTDHFWPHLEFLRPDTFKNFEILKTG
jgi:hypothetical protein